MELNFPFPFQPYDIQEKFMNELYYTIEKGKLGIFESPTGTVSISNYVLARKVKVSYMLVVGYVF